LNKPEWVDTPGLNYLLRRRVPEAAKNLKSREHYEPILLAGPTGTGKSYLRDRILEAAGFKQRNKEADPNIVVKVNCAAVPENLIDSALFGHVEGAFTGAKVKKNGLVGCGAKVLVLDEIGTLPQWAQAKLLMFLDTGEYIRIGATKNEKSETKILAITNTEPDKSGFREDLLYRFHLIRLPGLHLRRHDIPFLLAHFSPDVPWAKSDLLLFMAYNWPGNVRQLQKTIYWYTHAETPEFKVPINGVLQKFEWAGREPPFIGPTFQRLSDVFSSLHEQDPGLGSKIGTLIEHFPMDMWKLDDIAQLPPRSEDLADDEDIDNKELLLMKQLSWEWVIDWRFWCQLFRQDPQHNGDIIDCILTEEVTDENARLRPPSFGNWLPSTIDNKDLFKKAERMSGVWELMPRIDKIFFQRQTQPQSILPQSATSQKGRSELEPATRFSSAFKEVAEHMIPDEYKEQWYGHFSDLSDAELSKKFSGRIKRSAIHKHRDRDRKKKLNKR
jgi:hypothetical protein